MRSLKQNTEQVLGLIDLIYASAVEPGQTAKVLEAFNDLVGGTSSQIFRREKGTGAVSDSQISDTASISERANQQYVDHWGARDPRAALLASLPAGSVLRCHEHFDAAFVSSSDFYQDFFIPHGFRWAMGGMFDTGGPTCVVIANVRAPDLPAFEDWTAAALAQLLPHFKRASLIAATLSQAPSAESVGTRLMRQLPVPCLLTDEMGRCIEGNDGFTRAIGQLLLRLVTGRVRFSHPERQRQWEHALLETEATALGRTIEMPAETGSPFKMHLIPWRSLISGADAFDRKMILVVFDELPALQPFPNARDVAGVAGLTRAEFEVMASLLQGLPAKAIAVRRSAAVNTVRSQISTILQKTGHNSQKELIASFGNSSSFQELS